MKQLTRRTTLLICILIGPLGATAAEPVKLRVSPDGPLRSLAAARDEIRARRAKGEWKDVPITVRIAPGTYMLDEPLALGPEDSGTPEAPVTYAAEGKEQPVISGGRRITAIKEVTFNGKALWAASLDEVKAGKWYFHQLFVNDRRAPRTRLPKDGVYRFTGLPTTKPETKWGEGQDQAVFKPGDLRNWKNLPDVDIVAMSLWITSRLPIASVDETSHTVRFARKSTYRLTSGFATDHFSRYYVENVFEALDTPGEWYLDRPTGTLYYMPRPGETPDNTVIIAPRLAELVRASGTHDLRFESLRFQHADWWPELKTAPSGQAAIGVPAAVILEKPQRCVLRDCVVSHVSGYGVELRGGGEDNQIVNCDITDLGAGGVLVGHGGVKTTVTNCNIGPGGFLHAAGVGVWIGSSGDNTITHNDIHDFYYTGVSVGWSWGYGDSKAVRNKIEYNHIWNLGKAVLSDMGGIYTLGVSPGTTLRYNRIHDVEAISYGGWGIYNDEGSTGILIENNLVYRTTHGGYHQHYGKENIVRNNVFAFGMDWQLQRTREEEHISFTIEHNIVYWLAGPVLGGHWAKDKFSMDHNCYWRVDGKALDFAGMDLEKWRAKGHDVHSIVADPGFADAQAGDFALKPDSPALGIGFKPIDASRIGRQAGKASTR